MSDTFRRCQLCHEYGFFGNPVMGEHRCKPTWECRPEWEANDPDAWQTVHAIDAETAAEKYAERYDSDGGEYAIVSNRMRSDVIIQVRKPGDEEFERWDIEAETVPTYHATKIDAPALSPQETAHD